MELVSSIDLEELAVVWILTIDVAKLCCYVLRYLISHSFVLLVNDGKCWCFGRQLIR